MTTITLVLAIPLAAWKAFVLTVLWGWFITPVFGVAAPNLWLMCGIVLLWGVATYQIDRVPDVDTETKLWRLFAGLFIPAWALGIGWLYMALAAAAA